MATTDLMEAIKVGSCSFQIDYADELSVQDGGQLRVAQKGTDLWRARFRLSQVAFADAREIEALIGLLGGSRETFYAWAPKAKYPDYDPTGSILVSPGNVKINSLNADNLRMSLKGLPAGYRVTAGDMLAFDYGSGPSRALHRILSTRTADGTGVTSQFFVEPAIRTGAATNIVVTLLKAAAEMMIVPRTLAIEDGRASSSISFDALQVI